MFNAFLDAIIAIVSSAFYSSFSSSFSVTIIKHSGKESRGTLCGESRGYEVLARKLIGTGFSAFWLIWQNALHFANIVILFITKSHAFCYK